MATIDIIVPEMGESVRTGVVAKWHKADGDVVKRDEVIMDLETDKVTAEIAAPAAGRLKQMAKVGQTVAVQSVVGQVDESAAGAAPAIAVAPAAAAANGGSKDGAKTAKSTTPPPSPTPAMAPATTPQAAAAKAPAPAATTADVRTTPLAKKLAEEHGVDLAHIEGTGAGGRIREQDVLAFVQSKNNGSHAAPAAGPSGTASAAATPAGTGPAKRERLSPLRMRIAQRLVEAKNTAAMLTTFNEVDMTAVMELRKKYKEEFEKANAVGLGFMSFFVKAVVAALKQVPTVNAYLVPAADGGLEVEHHQSADIAVAVSTPKGLTVPVLRGCQNLSFAQIEQGIKALAVKARDGKLTLDDLQGGTFTITNGGIFGSLVSTPILNPPQTAILGMHAIKNRPVEDPDRPGQIALRPMMYLALSYDHRLLDGAQAVTFLVAIKNALEKPERLLIGI